MRGGIVKITMIVFILVLGGLYDTYMDYYPLIWNGNSLIGHAFGSIEGMTYTNSLEAFHEAYNRGIRTFEVDFQLTSDDKVVLAHDWVTIYGEEYVPTEEYFLSTKIFGKYTSLSFLDLLHLMTKYPDIWIVTDTKYTEVELVNKQFNEMVNVARENNLEYLLDRFIIQHYNEQMYETIHTIYPFKNNIFTMYMRWWGGLDSFNYLCYWAKSKGIKSITIHTSLFDKNTYEIAKLYDLDIYVHTENDISIANYYLVQGASGVYTDSMCIDDIMKIEQKN